MEKWLYVMIIKKGKTYNKVTKNWTLREKLSFAALSKAIPVWLAWSSLKHNAMKRQNPCASWNRSLPGDMPPTLLQPCK